MADPVMTPDRWSGFTADELEMLAAGCAMTVGVQMALAQEERLALAASLAEETTHALHQRMAARAATEPVGFVPPADPT